mmetsp:Transcript_83356/g.193710  ORF Transcript_83356/g.193710 Transcript_83356/m.193710 type:complete len:93 (+) Transcript_83356:77-355(+)
MACLFAWGRPTSVFTLLALLVLLPFSAAWHAADAAQDSHVDEVQDDTSFLQTYTVVHTNRGKRNGPPMTNTLNHSSATEELSEELLDDATSF